MSGLGTARPRPEPRRAALKRARVGALPPAGCLNGQAGPARPAIRRDPRDRRSRARVQLLPGDLHAGPVVAVLAPHSPGRASKIPCQEARHRGRPVLACRVSCTARRASAGASDGNRRGSVSPATSPAHPCKSLSLPARAPSRRQPIEGGWLPASSSRGRHARHPGTRPARVAACPGLSSAEAHGLRHPGACPQAAAVGCAKAAEFPIPQFPPAAAPASLACPAWCRRARGASAYVAAGLSYTSFG